MARTIITTDGARVIIDNGIVDAVNRALDKYAGTVVKPMQRLAQEQADKAAAKWPDKGRKKSPRATGRSRRAFDVVTEVAIASDGRGTIRVFVENTAQSKTGFFYAAVIRSRSAGTTGADKLKQPWNEFVAKPLRKKSEPLASELGIEIKRILGG